MSAVVVILIGIALAISPVDFTFESGEPGIQLFDTSAGIATRPGTFGYGCIAHNPPPWMLVLSF
jgi:hypothetical protein